MAEPPPEPIRREAWLPWILASAVVLLHLGIAAWHGALGASRNDDWTYLRILSDFESTGRFLPDPYTRTMLVGQVWLSRPLVEVFGVSIAALQVAVALLGAVGLRAAVAVLRRFLPLEWALFSVGILALGPIYGTVAVSFMSDVPAMAFQFVSLYLGLRAIEAGPRWAWPLALSLVTAFVGFTIREYAVAAFIAVLTAFMWVRRDLTSRSRTLVLTAALLWLSAALSLLAWRRSLVFPGQAEGIDMAPVGETLKVTLQTLFTLATLLLPAVVLLWRPAFWRRPRDRWLALVTAVLVVIAELATSGSILLGNYFTRYGSYALTVPGTRPETTPRGLWGVLMALTALAFAALTVLTLSRLSTFRSATGVKRRLRDLPPAIVLSGVFGVVGVAVVLAASALTNGSIFDRYLMPYVPFLASWVVWVALRTDSERPNGPTSRWSLPAAASVALALWAMVGLNQVDASATLDSAKWRMGEILVPAGYVPEEIDAGLEWFGLYQSGQVGSLVARPSDGLGFWHGLLDEPRVCVVVSYAGPSIYGAGPVVATIEARSLLGTEYALVAREIDVNCSSSR